MSPAPALAALCALVFLASCHTTGSSQPDGAGAGATSSVQDKNGGACDVVTCANFATSLGYVAGHAVALPGMPAPPPGSTLCGGTAPFVTNYYVTTQSPEAILDYYQKELPAHGFVIKSRDSGAHACSLSMDFHKKPIEIGNITAFSGGFAVLYGGR